MTWEAANCRLAADKLGTLWQGQAIAVISVVVMMVSGILTLIAAAVEMMGALGWVALLIVVAAVPALVGGIMSLAGLYGLGRLGRDYRTAFACQIVNLVLGLVNNWMGEGSPLYLLIDLATSVLPVAVIWLVVQATGQLLREAGREERNGRGMLAFWLSAAALAATYVISWLLDPLLEPTMMAALLLLPLAVSLAGGVLYILYLRAAARMMAEAAGEGNLFQREE